MILVRVKLIAVHGEKLEQTTLHFMGTFSLNGRLMCYTFNSLQKGKKIKKKDFVLIKAINLFEQWIFDATQTLTPFIKWDEAF